MVATMAWLTVTENHKKMDTICSHGDAEDLLKNVSLIFIINKELQLHFPCTTFYLSFRDWQNKLIHKCQSNELEVVYYFP